MDIEKITVNFLLYFPNSIDDLMSKGIMESFFANKVNAAIFNAMTRYRREFKKNISRIELEQTLLTLAIPKDVYAEHLNMTSDELIDINLEWLIKELFEHKRKQAITEGLSRVAMSINGNDVDEAERAIHDTSKYVTKLKPANSLLSDFNNENMLGNVGLQVPIKKVMSGYKEIDSVVNGFMPGELIVVAARPKTGKTRTLVNIIANMVRAGTNVLAFTLEVPKDQYIGLFYSCMTGIPYIRFKDKTLDKLDCDKIGAMQERLKKNCGRLVIFDTLKAVNPDFIRQKTEEIEAQFGIKFDVIAIDHATMMRPNKGLGGDWLDQGSIAEDLRSIGREMGRVMLTALQIRRSNANQSSKSKQNQEPGDELARSDTWFQTLDVLLALSKKEGDNSSYMSTLVVKIQPRHGEAATIELMKDFAVTLLCSVNDPSYQAGLTAFIPPGMTGLTQ